MLINHELTRKYTTGFLIPIAFSFGLFAQSESVPPAILAALAHTSQDKIALSPGATIEHEIAGGELHTYSIALAAGDFLRLVVKEQRIALTLSIKDPQGKTVLEGRSAIGSPDQKVLSIVSSLAGDYQLKLLPLRKDATRGRYELRIEELRPATRQDEAGFLGEQAFAEGRRLFSQRAAESLRSAVKKYEEAVSLYRTAGDRRSEVQAINAVGETYNLLGESQRAIAVFTEALLLSQKLNERLLEARSINNLGQAYRISGELLKALEYHNRYLSIMQQTGNRREQAAALSNIGAAYVDMSEPRKALKHITDALAIYRELGVPQGQAICLTNLGGIYNDLGEHEKALDHFLQALSLVRGYQYGEAALLINIGTAYRDKGDPKEALNYYRQAVPLARATGARRIEVEALAGIGAAYSESGEAEKALESLRNGLSLSRELGLSRQQGFIAHHIGRLYASTGQSQKALEHYTEALSLSRSSSQRLLEASTLSGIARVERDRGNLVEAEVRMEAAVEIIESFRTRVSGQDLKASFLASVRELYEFQIDLLARLDELQPLAGYGAAALTVSERSHARSLLESLVETRAEIRQGVPSELLDRERNLQHQMNVKAERFTRMLEGTHTDEQASAARRELDAILTEYQQLEAQIRTASPRYAGLTQPQPLSVKDIQQQVLDPDTLLLEYSLGEERSHLWAVSPTSITRFVLPNRAAIEAAARRVYQLLTASNQPAPKESPAQYQVRVAKAEAGYKQAATELSRMLLSPVASQLGSKRLLIVSEGALQYVPFDALPLPREARRGIGATVKGGDERLASPLNRVAQSRGRLVEFVPLLLEHEVVTAPSASVLSELRREMSGRQPAPKTVAVLADPVFRNDDPRINRSQLKAEAARTAETGVKGEVAPVPGIERSARESGLNGFVRLRFSRQEAEAISALVPPQKRLTALDFVASRETAQSVDLSQYRIVHFATHGLLDSQHPELSGVVLSLVDALGREQDGFLRLHEIYNLKLNADLVVLSACQTALGKEVRGEGLIGLTRGFMYAGTPRVVASLWRVDDRATAELMKRFYQAMLKTGLRPAAALRTARVSMLKEKNWSAPHYWAAFTLQGEWR
jgi:CHAT domain-containing protein